MWIKGCLVAAVCLLGASGQNSTDEGQCPYTALEDRRPALDNLWVIESGILVLAMNAGFGLLESGSVRAQNSVNIMMKNISDLIVGGLGWWILGFWIAFSRCGAVPTRVSDHSSWFFQWTFAATAATIDSGAVTERVAFLPYLLLSFFTTTIVYPFVVRWTWGGGFLHMLEPPFADFAGGTVVHTLGGVSALVTITILGPRIGRFNDYRPWKGFAWFCRQNPDPKNYMRVPGRPHIESVTEPVWLIYGTFLLWFGWYGFNPGGVGDVGAKGDMVVGRIVVSTTLGAIGGGCCAVAVMLLFRPARKIEPDGLAVGVLSGLCAITAGCKWFDSGTSLLVGCLGNVAAVTLKHLLQRARIDDVVSAVPVHLGGGALGTIAVGFFANPDGEKDPVGVFMASGAYETERAWRQLGVQLLGCLIVCVWCASLTAIFLTVLNWLPFLPSLRLSRDKELEGIDFHEHQVGHKEVSFHRTFERLVNDVVDCQGNLDRITQSFKGASTRITLANASSAMDESHSRTLKLEAKICRLEGMPSLAAAWWRPLHLRVYGEAVLASQRAGGKLELHTTFCECCTDWLQLDKLEMINQTLNFDIEMTHGAEQLTYVRFAVHLNGWPVLQAHKNVKDALERSAGRNDRLEQLDLRRPAEEPTGIFLVPKWLWGPPKLEAPAAKLHIALKRMGTHTVPDGASTPDVSQVIPETTLAVTSQSDALVTQPATNTEASDRVAALEAEVRSLTLKVLALERQTEPTLPPPSDSRPGGTGSAL